jgi:DNA repair exonuclease SbcCD nuclease subunit
MQSGSAGRKQMKRTTKIRTPSAILSADWHLREDTPVCRTDDFFATMEGKVDFILDLQKRYEMIPIIVAGDLLDNAISSPFLEAWAIEKLLGSLVVVIPGQHDLPNHNLDLYHKSSMAVLEQAGAVVVGKGDHLDTLFGRVHTFAYGQPIEPFRNESRPIGGQDYNICLAHVLIRKGRDLWPGMEAERARSLLDRLNYDLVVTGDNHQSFTVKRKGRLLVNPGSLMRIEADQDDYEPCVYLWYADDNEVEPVYLPIDKNVVTREHLEREEEREGRITAFVHRLDDDYEVKLSYKKNLRAHMRQNSTIKPVRNLVWESVGDE